MKQIFLDKTKMQFGHIDNGLMDINTLLPTMAAKKRRGRPCATERRHNELIQQKFTNMINSTCLNESYEEFTKLNVIPFIVKRQRRSRANDRERNRMETLNSALNALKQHLPMEM